MNYKIKWVSFEEYAELIKKHELSTAYPSGMNPYDVSNWFMDLTEFDGRDVIVIKVATSALMKELL